MQPIAHTITPVNHAICWRAIMAGAAVAVALSLVLSLIGFGLFGAAMAGSATESALLGLAVMQGAAAIVGGYLAGRMRGGAGGGMGVKSFFADGLQGLVMWALATGFVAAFLQPALPLVPKMADAAPELDYAYYADTLFRAPDPVQEEAAADAAEEDQEDDTPKLTPAEKSLLARGMKIPTAPIEKIAPGITGQALMPPPKRDVAAIEEAMRVLQNGLRGDQFPQAEHAYLVRRVAQETQMGEEAATVRVNNAIGYAQKLKRDALALNDQARKKAASDSLAMAGVLLCAALLAWMAAVFGGKRRAKALPAA